MDNPSFKALVSKINSTLVIAPSVLKVVPSASINSNADTPTAEKSETTFDPVLGMQIDAQPIEYVPKAKRVTTVEVESTARGMEDMGPIVVVGRKAAGGAKKKRKRALAADGVRGIDDDNGEGGAGDVGASGGETVSAVVSEADADAQGGSGGEAGEDVPYDFAATSNILDSTGLPPPTKKAKTAKKKGGKKDEPKGTGYFYGDFGAAPKQRSDFKGGNKSLTFK